MYHPCPTKNGNLLPKQALDVAVLHNYHAVSSLPRDQATMLESSASSYNEAIEHFRYALNIVKHEMNEIQHQQQQQQHQQQEPTTVTTSTSPCHLTVRQGNESIFFVPPQDDEPIVGQTNNSHNKTTTSRKPFVGFNDQDDLFVFTNSMLISSYFMHDNQDNNNININNINNNTRSNHQSHHRRLHLVIMSLRLLYNLGLSHHMQAYAKDHQHNEQSQRSCFQRALYVYELAYTIYLKEEQEQQEQQEQDNNNETLFSFLNNTMSIQIAIIVNNMGQIHAKLQDWDRSANCFDSILSSLPYLQQEQQNYNNNNNCLSEEVLSAFLNNAISCYVLKGPKAAAAA